MLRFGLDRCGLCHEPALVAIDSSDCSYAMTALGERPGLVEQDHIDAAHPLEREPILYQDSVARRHPGGDRDHEGNGQSEGVRTGDHQNGHGSDHRLLRLGRRQPGDDRDHRGAKGHVEQQRRSPVGEHLSAGLRLLSLGDEELDPGQSRVCANCFDLDPNRVVGRNGPGDHSLARPFCNRFRLAGHHRLVDVHFSGGDRSIGRHPAAGSDENFVTYRELGNGDRFGACRGNSVCLVRQQIGERSEGAAGLADGAHLHPVAEQHDGDEGRELPPELEVKPAESGGGRSDVGDRDRHTDQKHHPGLAILRLLHRSLQKRRTSIDEKNGAENRSDPGRPGKGRSRVSEPLLDRLGEEDDRKSQRQRQPEAVSEHVNAVAGVLVVATAHVLLAMHVVVYHDRVNRSTVRVEWTRTMCSNEP